MPRGTYFSRWRFGTPSPLHKNILQCIQKFIIIAQLWLRDFVFQKVPVNLKSKTEKSIILWIMVWDHVTWQCFPTLIKEQTVGEMLCMAIKAMLQCQKSGVFLLRGVVVNRLNAFSKYLQVAHLANKRQMAKMWFTKCLWNAKDRLLIKRTQTVKCNRELRGWRRRGCREGCQEPPEKGA